MDWYFYIFLAEPLCLWDLSSLTRDPKHCQRKYQVLTMGWPWNSLQFVPLHDPSSSRRGTDSRDGGGSRLKREEAATGSPGERGWQPDQDGRWETWRGQDGVTWGPQQVLYSPLPGLMLCFCHLQAMELQVSCLAFLCLGFIVY